MEDVLSVALEDFIRYGKPSEYYNNEVAIMEIDEKTTPGENVKDFTIRLDAYSAFLVCKGEVTITTDYLPYKITQNMVMEFNNKHIMNSIYTSQDTKGYFLMFGKNLFREFPQVVTLPQEYIIHKRFNPIQKFDSKDFNILVDTVERLRNNIRRKEHVFHHNMVITEIGNFMMELVNMNMQFISSKTEYKIGYNEDLAIRFVRLIVKHGIEWHEVSQYSTELCVTPVYLSRAVKAASGKTPMEWINEARVSEAKILLRRPDMMIQDVADLLKFSDQSSFGKFFKKHTGISPLEYKKSF